MSTHNCLNQLKNIDLNDLPYVERDLDFGQKVSLCFLLFGSQHSNVGYILQKLMALASSSALQPQQDTNLLPQYAQTNPQSWRNHLVEALCIIDARRVLRKLGFRWQELRLHYLPHVTEITLHVHPLLKALYVICEQLTVVQAGRMVINVNEMVAARQRGVKEEDPLRFYDFAYLEIFVLSWLWRRLIQLGDINAEGSNMELLIEYFKLNDLHAQALLIKETINSNVSLRTEVKCEPDDQQEQSEQEVKEMEPATSSSSFKRRGKFVKLRREPAGIVLVINQQSFHTNVSEDLKPLLPPAKLKPRLGTDVDQKRLHDVFSSLGYRVECHNNVDHMDMIRLIRGACERSLLPDSLIVCILSHGFEGAVYGHDSIALKLSDIENVLCSNENLRDKTKLLIIQACQTEDQKNPGKVRLINATTQSPSQHVNMVLAMSTVPGFAAMRHTQQGSWFIQCLCDAIIKHSASEHIADILTIVTDMVAEKRGNNNESMLSKTHSTLRQPVYFPA